MHSSEPSAWPLSYAIMVHIAGWADNTGTGWAIGDDIVELWATRFSVSKATVGHAIQALQVGGFIQLGPLVGETNARKGQMLFPNSTDARHPSEDPLSPDERSRLA